MESKAGQEGPSKPSFAKVAAMRPPSKSQSATAQNEQNTSTPAGPITSPPVSHTSTTTIPNEQNADNVESAPMTTGDDMGNIDDAVRDLNINALKEKEISGSQTEPQEDTVNKTEGAFEDDQTHLSNSSTKPTSFDSKSVVSVATFAMDEKESLRPDDSASVQAAEEVESLNGRVSSAPNSRMGSEASERPRHNYTDGPEHLATSQRTPGILPSGPQFNGGLQIAGAPPSNPIGDNFVMSNPDAFQNDPNLNGFPTEPDEKLLEAMNSPKDRLLLLQLEEKIVSFIKDPSEPSLELPPCNAFGRLLAHKLGDYYHLTHFVDNNVTSVRLHRTPWSRLPTPLPMLQGANANNTPPPNAPAMKIMRRVGQPGERTSSTAASSSAPSKATSEIGEAGSEENRNGASSSAGVTPAKDRATMSREEREAKYQEARERIFRDFPESKSSDNPASADHSANMSRSSSMSGRKKSHRQKTPHDDSFEARSQFNAFYPGMPYSSGQVPISGGMSDGIFAPQGHYVPGPGASPSGFSNGHNGQANTIYTSHVNFASMTQYPQQGMSPNLPQGNMWQGGQMSQQTPYPGYMPVNQPPQMMSQQSSTRSSPSMNNYALPNPPQYQQPAPSWNPSPYPGGLQQPPTNSRNPPPVHWPNYPQSVNNQMPYQYNQVPNQAYNPVMQHPTSQHPLPGSFNRAPFNPQTRSFVPGSNSPGRYPGKSPQSTPNAPYMKHQGSKPQPWGSPQDTQSYPAMIPNSHPNKQPMPTNQPSHASNQRGLPVTRDSIAKWGTPSHLPPKPPPSQVPSEFDMKNRPATLPTQSHPTNAPANNNKGSSPLVVSGGSGLPKPNNGTTGL
ncbi:hypothetical protein FQN54_002119 [Arachnomyces sp. PD_36]|nr:hypothetical protein FQN54_002119 [Arachnomyces sp. PD_36]